MRHGYENQDIVDRGSWVFVMDLHTQSLLRHARMSQNVKRQFRVSLARGITWALLPAVAE